MPDSRDLEEAEEALKEFTKAHKICAEETFPALRREACEGEDAKASEKAWKGLLTRVEQNHAWRIRNDLGRDTVLDPVYPDPHVQRQFLDSCSSFDHHMSITYHGTKACNISSIQRRGLLVPGHGGVKVANGSAHGVGIYTAQIGSSSLSRGFCDSDKLFVCGVCDTSLPFDPDNEPFAPSMTHVQTVFPKRYLFQGRMFGRYTLTQESDEVRHVGQAVVVFNEKCVVPLFIATVKPSPSQEQTFHREDAEEAWVAGPQQIGRRRLIVPENDGGLIKFGSIGNGRSGRTVWLPPMPKKDSTAHERAVQRRLCGKAWKRLRCEARQPKVEDMTHLFD